jgi:hypothetical protein
MKRTSTSTRISLLLLTGLLLMGCRDAKSFLWRQAHHRNAYHHYEKSVRRLGAAFRRPVPPPIPAKPGHRKRR